MKDAYILYDHRYLPKWVYISLTPVFCWLNTKNAIKGVFKQATGWHGCRETFATELKREVVIAKEKEKTSKIATNKLRIGIMLRTHIGYRFSDATRFVKASKIQDDWMLRATKVLNVVEKYLGWSLTSVGKDKSKDATAEENKANVYVFTASPKWLRSPQLISLYLLLIRVSSVKSFGKVHSLDDIIKVMAGLGHQKISANEEAGLGSDDVAYASRIAPHLKKVLDNLDKLFFSRSLYHNHYAQTGCYGIYCLIENKSLGGDDYIRRRYKEFCKEN